jgi:hypothetical protein
MTMKNIIAAITAIACTASVASAQSPAQTAPKSATDFTNADDVGPKAPGTATAYAIGGSLLGPALIGLAVLKNNNTPIADGRRGTDESTAITQSLAVAGGVAMLVAPSAGRWYAGEIGTGPILIRGAGAAIMVLGVGQAVSNLACGHGDSSCSDNRSGASAVLLGGAIFIGGTIYDIVTSGDAARRYNHKHNNSTLSSLSVAPIAHRSNSTGNVTGLSLTGSF